MPQLASKTFRLLLALLGLTLIAITPVWSQSENPSVRVAAAVLPPFVMQQDSQLVGFSIDLWNEIAARLNAKTAYQTASDVDALLNSLREKRADAVVSGLFYTTARDREFDFSNPILEAGLQIMVRDEGSGLAPTPFRDVFDLLFSRSAAVWLGVALIIIIIPAHLLWLLDRGDEESVSPSREYLAGIFDAATWATTALVSQVQSLPKRWPARIFGLLWMFAGVVFIALYTAELTATLTVEQIRGAINGPGDLPGKRVATISNSTASAFLQKVKANAIEFPSLQDADDALMSRTVDAVLFAAPALRYFAAHEGRGRVKMVGPEFNRQEVGFLFQLGDPLRRRASSALIAMREDGTYQRFYEKWFGNE